MRRPAVVVAAALLASAPVMASAATTGTPYRDPSAVGGIGLCDRSGHEITSGSITAKPFAWRAVSSAPAKAPYDGVDRTATLYAFQPRQDLSPGDWSGDQLTAASRFTNPAHPMAQATSADSSLRDFMEEFRPEWDGLLQLRIFLGAPGQATDSFSYPAVSIKVTGSTWQVVNPVTVSCTAGSAESIESILLPGSGTSTAAHHKSAGHHHRKSSRTSSHRNRTAGAVRPVSAVRAADSSSSDGNHSTGPWAALVAGIAAIGGAGAVALRRRTLAHAPAASATKESK